MSGVGNEPRALREILAAFADEIGRAEEPFEAVSVEVRRDRGFRNEATTPRGLRVVLDEPVHFGGSGEAPDPAEYLLAAIGASLSVTLTAHAALREVSLDRVHVALAARIDGRPFFEPRAGVGTPGLLDVVVTLTVATGASRREFAALLRDVLKATPVIQTLKRRPRVVVRYESRAEPRD